MLVNCNSCQKRFVVPDSAITDSGRLVQCGSCGNKWRQYPNKNITTNETVFVEKATPKIKVNTVKKTKPIKKNKRKKRVGPNLYSPEYLAKKHGIRINENVKTKTKNLENKEKINFGFYNSLLVFLIFVIFTLRILYFSQDIIVKQFPVTKIYIIYLFESIKNISEIIINFFFSY
ncbi:zinc-ribbon domain-containing protein [Candidatus Pelagibacter bacterium]|nr:zinc-ribbon domain-containing protein [Candidatus Pelagibacter bacterium]MDA9625086.1 zinc-ribbon domain-containing protein [Candidatus Pelagibacter bacterium]